MDKGNAPGGSTYQFLWLCVKHTQRSTVSPPIVVALSHADTFTHSTNSQVASELGRDRKEVQHNRRSSIEALLTHEKGPRGESK